MNCPLCGFKDAYVGFMDIECGNVECKKYVDPKKDDETKVIDVKKDKPGYFIHADYSSNFENLNKPSFLTSNDSYILIKTKGNEFKACLERYIFHLGECCSEVNFSFPQKSGFLNVILNLATNRNEDFELANEEKMFLCVEGKLVSIENHLIDRLRLKVSKDNETISCYMVTKAINIHHAPEYKRNKMLSIGMIVETELNGKNNCFETFSFEIRNNIQPMYSIGLFGNPPEAKMVCGRRDIEVNIISDEELVVDKKREIELKISDEESIILEKDYGFSFLNAYELNQNKDNNCLKYSRSTIISNNYLIRKNEEEKNKIVYIKKDSFEKIELDRTKNSAYGWGQKAFSSDFIIKIDENGNRSYSKNRYGSLDLVPPNSNEWQDHMDLANFGEKNDN